jgi:hypothetical protein
MSFPTNICMLLLFPHLKQVDFTSLVMLDDWYKYEIWFPLTSGEVRRLQGISV